MSLAPALVSRGLIRAVEVCDILVADARAAREIMLIGSSIEVAPIVGWDVTRIGTGTPGPVAKALAERLDADRRCGAGRITEMA